MHSRMVLKDITLSSLKSEDQPFVIMIMNNEFQDYCVLYISLMAYSNKTMEAVDWVS